MNYVYAGSKHFFEILGKIDIFAGTERNAAVVCEFFKLLGLLPRSEVLHPGNVVLFHSAGKADCVLDCDVTEMIDRQRHFVAYYVAHFAHVVFEIVHSLFRKVYAGGEMRNGENLIVFSEHQRLIDGAGLMANRLHVVLFVVFYKSYGRVESAGFVVQKLDSEVHFKKREALLHSLFERHSHIFAGVFPVHIGIAVNAHFVAPLAA